MHLSVVYLLDHLAQLRAFTNAKVKTEGLGRLRSNKGLPSDMP